MEELIIFVIGWIVGWSMYSWLSHSPKKEEIEDYQDPPETSFSWDGTANGAIKCSVSVSEPYMEAFVVS